MILPHGECSLLWYLIATNSPSKQTIKLDFNAIFINYYNGNKITSDGIQWNRYPRSLIFACYVIIPF